MKIRNIKIAILAGGMLALWMSPARADILYVGGTYSTDIPMLENGTPKDEAGGSIDNSTLNGRAISLYCVDLFDNVYVGNSYDQTMVSTAGIVNGQLVDHADEVAWLFDHYDTTGQSDQAKALQAAIWTVIYDGTSPYAGGHTVTLDSALASPGLLLEYNAMLSALASANTTGYTSTIDWVTPDNGSGTIYQGLIANAVPEPTTIISGALMLLPFGASAVRILRKRATA